MLETTFLFVLGLGHVAVIAAILLGFRETWGPVVVASALLAVVLFGMAAMGATNVEIITDSGETVSNPQPGVGYYAMGMAMLSGIVAMLAGVASLKDQEESPYGNSY